MSIDSAVRSEIEERIDEDERTRCECVKYNIRTIISHLFVSQIELAVAIGVYAPPFGVGGNCGVNSWCRGNERPTNFNYYILEYLASGCLRLRQTGFDQRRLIYNIFGEFCPKCGSLLRRVWGSERCTRSSFCDYFSGAREDPSIRVVNHGAVGALPDQFSRIREELSSGSAEAIKGAHLVRCDSRLVEFWLAGKDSQRPDRGMMDEILGAAISVLTSEGVECGKGTKLKIHVG